MSARQQADDAEPTAVPGRGSLPRSMGSLAGRLVGLGLRTTVEVAAAATRAGAHVAVAVARPAWHQIDDRSRPVRTELQARAAAAADHAFSPMMATIIDRVDLNALLARVDIDELASRIDLNGLVTRIDLDAVVRKVDVVGIAREVIDGVDLPGIIRDSTGTMATETVDGLRLQTMHADQAVSHLVDRIIRRNGGRVARGPTLMDDP